MKCEKLDFQQRNHVPPFLFSFNSADIVETSSMKKAVYDSQRLKPSSTSSCPALNGIQSPTKSVVCLSKPFYGLFPTWTCERNLKVM